MELCVTLYSFHRFRFPITDLATHFSVCFPDPAPLTSVHSLSLPALEMICFIFSTLNCKLWPTTPSFLSAYDTSPSTYKTGTFSGYRFQMPERETLALLRLRIDCYFNQPWARGMGHETEGVCWGSTSVARYSRKEDNIDRHCQIITRVIIINKHLLCSRTYT